MSDFQFIKIVYIICLTILSPILTWRVSYHINNKDTMYHYVQNGTYTIVSNSQNTYNYYCNAILDNGMTCYVFQNVYTQPSINITCNINLQDYACLKDEYCVKCSYTSITILLITTIGCWILLGSIVGFTIYNYQHNTPYYNLNIFTYKK